MPKSSLSEITFTQGYSLSSIRKPFESKNTCSSSDWSKSLGIQKKWSIFFNSNWNYPNMIVFVKIIEPKVHKLYLFHQVFLFKLFLHKYSWCVGRFGISHYLAFAWSFFLLSCRFFQFAWVSMIFERVYQKTNVWMSFKRVNTSNLMTFESCFLIS